MHSYNGIDRIVVFQLVLRNTLILLIFRAHVTHSAIKLIFERSSASFANSDSALFDCNL